MKRRIAKLQKRLEQIPADATIIPRRGQEVLPADERIDLRYSDLQR